MKCVVHASGLLPSSFVFCSVRGSGFGVQADLKVRLYDGPTTVYLQIRWKFFSTSRRVSRSMTGRPCGQIVENAVSRSSSRM